MLSTWPALVFILPKRLDLCRGLYYNVEVIRRIVMSMYLTALGAAFVFNLGYAMVTGHNFMICISGCN